MAIPLFILEPEEDELELDQEVCLCTLMITEQKKEKWNIKD
jgi:hypothetical protein